MEISIGDLGIRVESIRHQSPGKYVQQILGDFKLNPFLVRVRSRDLHLNPFQTHRHTVIWAHESLHPLYPKTIPTRRRYLPEDNNFMPILEQVYVVYTSHSGLQTGPRRFEKMTEIARRVVG